MSNILIGIGVAIIVLLLLMYFLSVAFQEDLKNLEKTNPKYRQYLKDKYKI